MKAKDDHEAVEVHFWKAINIVLLDTKDLPVDFAFIDELSEVEAKEHENLKMKVTALTTRLNKFAWKAEGGSSTKHLSANHSE